MAALKIIVSLLFLLSNGLLIGNTAADGGEAASTDEKKDAEPDLEAAEANGKLEIIKQIKKVNDDGSYTIGYEADDGSFKIESRDVLGNIKGTYGYIDDRGEIKRVSYSTSNTTAPEVIASTNEPPSVVQRIPSKVNRTTAPTSTRRPWIISSTTASPLTSTTRRKVVATTQQQFIQEALIAASKSTAQPTTTLYDTSTPARILAQYKPLVRSTSTPVIPKTDEGQLGRPEVVLKTTDMPLYRRLPIKTTLLDEDTRPVTESPEAHSNVLRRQLPQEGANPKITFDPRQHVLNIQQGAGDDTVDIYSASVTTATPRPLFTTLRPRIQSSTTATPLIHSRPTQPALRFATYQRPSTTQTVTEYTQESSTEPTVTPSPVPVVQIPANHQEPQQRQPFVQLRHPFQRGAILVPVTHITQPSAPDQGRYEEDNYQQDQQQPVYGIRRVPNYRQVHVDENGFIREFSTQAPYQPQQHGAAQQYLSQNDIINEVDRIRPPVSTRDFQKLLEHLIQRQSRLERISALARNPELFRPRPVYQEVPVYEASQPVQFIPRNAQPHPALVRHRQQQPDVEKTRYGQYGPVAYTPSPTPHHQSYQPAKRMVPLQQETQQGDEEYLPAPIREMLLLRMLQLAINPSLPLEVMDNLESATTPVPSKETHHHQVRNVEILGEDVAEQSSRRPARTKRYKQVEFDYYD